MACAARASRRADRPHGRGPRRPPAEVKRRGRLDACRCSGAPRTRSPVRPGCKPALAAASWPAGFELRVRIALHTGEAHERDGDYFGPALNRAARLRSLARGGVTLISQATMEIVRDRLPDEVELVDVGHHALRGVSRPERVFELRRARRRRPHRTRHESRAAARLALPRPLQVSDGVGVRRPRSRARSAAASCGRAAPGTRAP